MTDAAGHDRADGQRPLPPPLPNAAAMAGDGAGRAMEGRPCVPAHFLARLVAAVLDGLIVFAIALLPDLVLRFFIGLFAAVRHMRRDDIDQGVRWGVMVVVFVLISTVYRVVLDASAGQGTWGKQFLGIRVTDLQGRRITFDRSLARNLAASLSCMACGFGYLLPLITSRRQTLHDMIANCLAVQD